MKRIKLIFNPHADRGRAWDIASSLKGIIAGKGEFDWASTEYPGHATEIARQAALEDRKSTRLNSSHGYISDPAFCLIKKTSQADKGSHSHLRRVAPHTFFCLFVC